MNSFLKWLESNALMSPKLSHGDIGNFDNYDDDDDNDDDDYENGPWGWNKMESLNLKLHEWARTSPHMRQIKEIIANYLFNSLQKQVIRIFPTMVQLEIEWEADIDKWTDMDNQVEAILKKSDLYKVLGIDQNQLWNVVDKGAVYDYMMYVILLNLTGRSTSSNKTSPLDDLTKFQTWEYVQQNYSRLEPTIKQHVQNFWHENGAPNIQIQLTPGRSTNKPSGLAQVFENATKLWARGSVSIPYQILGQVPQNPEYWQEFGEEIPL